MSNNIVPAIKAASANHYGVVFYGLCVQYHNLKQSYKKKLTSIHYRLLRMAKRDYKMQLSRNEQTELCCRATPEQWTKCITATRVIKIIKDKTPKYIYPRISYMYFEERSHPYIGFFYDTSRNRKGRQAIQNGLLFKRAISYHWNTDEKLSNDILIRFQR